MNKEELEKYVTERMSTRDIAKLLSTSQTNVRYHLKKFNLKTNPKLDSYDKEDCRICLKCKNSKHKNDFYKRRNKDGNSVYCKICTNIQAISRQRKFKEQCVQYKGRGCERCSYSTYIGALEFHHTDPSKKDFGLSKRKSLAFNDLVKLELDKCLLLCSNCHKEEHARQRGLI